MSDDFFDYDALELEALMRIGHDGFVNVEPPYGDDELFHDQFNRRAREITRQPNELKPVHVIPQKKGPWTGNNQLGFEQVFAPDANNKQTILKMDEWDFPQVWSVMLGLTPPETVANPVIPPLVYYVTALVQTGTGGITDTFEVDWQPGIAFSVVANALNIQAVYDVPNSTNLPTGLLLRALVGKRPLPGGAPTRTITLGISAGASSTIAIPKYAKSVSIMPGFFPAGSNNPYAALINYQTRPSPNTTIFQSIMTGTQILALGNGATMPIPGGARFLRVFNGEATDCGFTLVFNLGL